MPVVATHVREQPSYSVCDMASSLPKEKGRLEPLEKSLLEA